MSSSKHLDTEPALDSQAVVPSIVQCFCHAHVLSIGAFNTQWQEKTSAFGNEGTPWLGKRVYFINLLNAL